MASPVASVKAGTTYVLMSKRYGTYFDVDPSDSKLSQIPLGAAFSGAASQQWTFEDAGSGLFYIKNGQGSYVAYEGAIANETRVKLGGKQAWRIVPDAKDSTCIKIYHPTANYGIDIWTEKVNNTIHLWENSLAGTWHQSWVPTLATIPVKAGSTYTLTSKRYNAFLDVNPSSNRYELPPPLSDLVGASSAKLASQIWMFEDARSGLFYIKNTTQGSYITFSGAIENKTNVKLGSRQAWRITTDPLDPACIKILHPAQYFGIDIWTDLVGNPLHLWDVTLAGLWHQSFIPKPASPPAWNGPVFDPSFAPVFFLVNRATETVADVSNGVNKALSLVPTVTHSNGYRTLNGAVKTKQIGQIWFIETADATKSLFYLKTQAAGGGYIGVDGQAQDGAPVIITDSKVQWQIRPDPNDNTLIRIYYPGTNFLLDLAASNAADGTPITLRLAQSPGANQFWNVEPAQ